MVHVRITNPRWAAFPAHAQHAILQIWHEAHWTDQSALCLVTSLYWIGAQVPSGSKQSSEPSFGNFNRPRIDDMDQYFHSNSTLRCGSYNVLDVPSVTLTSFTISPLLPIAAPLLLLPPPLLLLLPPLLPVMFSWIYFSPAMKIIRIVVHSSIAPTECFLKYDVSFAVIHIHYLQAIEVLAYMMHTHEFLDYFQINYTISAKLVTILIGRQVSLFKSWTPLNGTNMTRNVGDTGDKIQMTSCMHVYWKYQST